MGREGKRIPAVKLVRGPFIRLQPHPEACADESQLSDLCATIRRVDRDRLLVADLFAGAGGLSLGLEKAGMKVVLSVDHDPDSVETHGHHFTGLTRDWDLGDPAIVEHVARLIRDNGIPILAGGPPCQPFSKAGRSLIRHRVRLGLRDPHDQRRDLWRSYLEVIRLARPRAVIMENVPDMALDREMFILRSMVLELEQLGYGVEVKVVDTWRYGVPQFRQRLILVALAESLAFNWPDEVSLKVTVNNAISDLPTVDGGWRPTGGADGWTAYSGPVTDFQRGMRDGVEPSQADRIYDHITRPVRPDDAAAFALMDSTTRYSELPEEFKRYRDDIFDDKYKRLDGDDLSRTITAHIAKDGYWYIHPQQDRTITIREAARLQTFPDWFRFAGPPSAAFKQIGNAVPPRLGLAIGQAVMTALTEARPSPPTSEQSSATLAHWMTSLPAIAVPWLRASTRWQVLAAEKLLERATAQTVRAVWPLMERWGSPSETLEAADELEMVGRWVQRDQRSRDVISLARTLVEDNLVSLSDDILEELVNRKLLAPAQADLAELAASMGDDDVSEEPVIINKGVLRVAARYFGDSLDRRNRLTDGRIAVARLIGFGSSARQAHLGLMELSNSLCRPVEPECSACPLAEHCAGSRLSEMRSEMLPGLVDLTVEPERTPQLG